MSFYNQITQKSVQFSLMAFFNKSLPLRSHEDCSKPSAIVCLQRTLLKHPIKTKRQAHAPVLMVIQQCSIFPGRRQPSIFDDEKLNFCVRDGNRWNLLSIATGYGIITLNVYYFFIISNIKSKVKQKVELSS